MASAQSAVGERLATNVATAPGSIAIDASPLLPAPAPCLFGGCLLLLWHLGEHACSPNDERCAPRIEMRDTGRIVYWHVKDKDRKGHIGRIAHGHHAELVPRRWIRVFGVDAGAAFDRVFAVGDEAAYSGYNLTYTGQIEAIGNTTVTVRDGRIKRLSIFDFVFWNHRFDAAATRARNREVMARI